MPYEGFLTSDAGTGWVTSQGVFSIACAVTSCAPRCKISSATGPGTQIS